MLDNQIEFDQINKIEDKINIKIFEFILAPSGNVLLSFIGRARIMDNSKAILGKSEILILRENNPPISFGGLNEQKMLSLANAPNILVYRTFNQEEELVDINI